MACAKWTSFQLNDGFEFDHDQVLDEEVYAACPDFMSAVKDGHFLFAFKGKVVIGEFNFHCALVNDFLKTISKRGVNFHGGGNNAAGQIFVFHLDFRLPIKVILQSF